MSTPTFTAARFATRWPSPNTAVVTARGEIDASNSPQFLDYALRHCAHDKRLVVDMSGVDFFATAGIAALHELNVHCAGESIEWAAVSSAAVVRILRLCDTDPTLPTYGSIEEALSAV